MLLLSTWHLTFAILFYATIDVLALKSFVTFIFVLKAVFFLKKKLYPFDCLLITLSLKIYWIPRVIHIRLCACLSTYHHLSI